MMALAMTVFCLGTAAVVAADSGAADAGVPGAFFFESFGFGWQDRWHYSRYKKYEGRFETVEPQEYQDTAIQMPAGNQHYGMTAQLPEPLLPSDGIVVQYEVQFAQGHTCGGAYLKLLSQTPEELKPEQLKPKTPFSIMFGPDRCGSNRRVHVILSMLNPVTQQQVEHHLMSAPAPKADNFSHVYTLVLYQNHMYKVLIDGRPEGTGLLAAADFTPPLQPPADLPDPAHAKPEDWVEEDEIDDPSAVKPADWDDRRLVADPNAQKPHGWLDGLPARVADPAAAKPARWDDARHGEWLRPSIPNPACKNAPGCGPWTPPTVTNPSYKGPWIPPRVRNPDYKGPWQQRTIPNPAYFKAEAPLTLLAPIVGVAFELWVTEPGYTFDNILLGKVGQGQQGIAAAAYMGKVGRARRLAQEAAAAAAAAAARASSRPPGWLHWPTNKLLDLMESPPLAAYLVRLQPVAAALEPVAAALEPVAAALEPVAAALERWHVLSPWWLLPLLVLGLGLEVVNRRLVCNKAGASARAELTSEELEEAAAQEEDRMAEEQIRVARQAAKLKAASRAAAGAAAAAAGDHYAATPAGSVTQRRRSTRHQQLQQQAEYVTGVETPAARQQQQKGQQEDGQGSSPEDRQTPGSTRSTRRTARKA